MKFWNVALNGVFWTGTVVAVVANLLAVYLLLYFGAVRLLGWLV